MTVKLLALLGRHDFSVDLFHALLGGHGLALKAFFPQDGAPIRIETKAISPAGAGLGGSSALTISVLAALQEHVLQEGHREHKLTEKELVRTAQNIESQIIHSPTGSQDYLGAVRGALNWISFPFEGEQVHTLANRNFCDLTRKMIICYCGQSRASACNN